MGLFDGIKKKIDEKKEAERKRQEEEKRKREEATRLDPKEKPLEWFSSEDGLQAFGQYFTISNYLLEEEIKEEQKANKPDTALEIYAMVYHPEAKLPCIYLSYFIESIDAQMLRYVAPADYLNSMLSIQARPYCINEDGEPEVINPMLPPEVLLSVEKNPLLNYIVNFKNFLFGADEHGTAKDKWMILSTMMTWLSCMAKDSEILAKNPWVFSDEVYFNDVGTVRKEKSFYKQCIDLAGDEETKAYFKHQYEKCE